MSKIEMLEYNDVEGIGKTGRYVHLAIREFKRDCNMPLQIEGAFLTEKGAAKFMRDHGGSEKKGFLHIVSVPLNDANPFPLAFLTSKLM